MTLSDSSEFFRQSAKNLLDLAVSICSVRYGVIVIEGEPAILSDPGAPLHVVEALKGRRELADHLFAVFDFHAGVALLDQSGESRGTLALVHDRPLSITDEQKSAVLKIAAEVMRGMDRAAAIREANHAQTRFRALVDGAPAAILATRVGSRRFSYVNRAFAEKLGYSVAEILAFPDLRAVITADHWGVVDEIIRRREAGEQGNLSFDTRVCRRDGTILDAEIHTSIIDVNGEELAVGVAIDTTDRKRTERQIAQLDRLTSLGRLAAQVAHEFNNVMMGIQPVAEAIRRRVAGDQTLTRYTDVIMASLQRGKRLTTDILRFGRPAHLDLRPVHVNALLKDTAEEIRPLLGAQIDLDVSCPDDICLQGDAAQLTQVLMNLALNARDSMEPHGGRLSLLAEREETLRDGASFIHICVRDTGAGVAPEDLPYIFEPLFTTKNRGTGLGLSVAFQVVAAHGGQIVADSKPGEGAAFHLFIPAAAVGPEEKAEAAETVIASDSIRVLVVEDDETVATGLRWLLNDAGMTVRVVTTGAAVLPAIEAERPDVVVLDLSLPDEDGRTVFRRIAAHYSIPVIFSSGHATEGDVEEILKRPRAVFLMKPYAADDLVKAIRKVIQ